MAPRARLIGTAVRLEWLTAAWLSVEAAIALASGIRARSISLIAFGLDSLIELVSAGVLIWPLTVELHRGQSFGTAAERKAANIGGALLLALAAYVVAAGGWSLWTHRGQGFSWPGLIITTAAIPVMWLLSRRKLGVAEALGSRALRTDAVESIACGWLSSVVIVGLLGQLALGEWWVDPLTSLAIVWLLVKEGREAWRSEAENH